MEIKVENLCKSYDGVQVLKNVSFTAGPGVTCVMAPSGAGKTTLLRILLGLERPDSGNVRGTAEGRFAAVFQEDRLLEQLDAMENLGFVLGGELNQAGAESLLAELGLSGEHGKPVREYSGGMKRRLALARALLVPFDALVLDEPFTGLDEENRKHAIACIRSRTAGKPVLLVTHSRDDAAGLDAQTVVLEL
ncbi:NitT/TauT family transport system ATP-binding protein [Oscillibacter sp. PC13]|uniref:ATP-binding cassette domain-containing protein n=1 Tax=Oscillibacter sp. PC13 TaxID=1855299 RepID=UPI0008F10A17|nr:ATP-binding cassette domain-containing protein [Oscillibacter sp. PC13]SFP34260.1 NitT/TauT family transport system ATP-binding protein [Oscillibacter sp. PC13]